MADAPTASSPTTGFRNSKMPDQRIEQVPRDDLQAVHSQIVDAWTTAFRNRNPSLRIGTLAESVELSKTITPENDFDPKMYITVSGIDEISHSEENALIDASPTPYDVLTVTQSHGTNQRRIVIRLADISRDQEDGGCGIGRVLTSIVLIFVLLATIYASFFVSLETKRDFLYKHAPWMQRLISALAARLVAPPTPCGE